MKLQFKHQKFQADAAKAVVDVFAGQPYLTPSYMMDRGTGTYQMSLTDEQDLQVGAISVLYRNLIIRLFWITFRRYRELIRSSLQLN